MKGTTSTREVSGVNSSSNDQEKSQNKENSANREEQEEDWQENREKDSPDLVEEQTDGDKQESSGVSDKETKRLSEAKASVAPRKKQDCDKPKRGAISFLGKWKDALANAVPMDSVVPGFQQQEDANQQAETRADNKYRKAPPQAQPAENTLLDVIAAPVKIIATPFQRAGTDQPKSKPQAKRAPDPVVTSPTTRANFHAVVKPLAKNSFVDFLSMIFTSGSGWLSWGSLAVWGAIESSFLGEWWARFRKAFSFPSFLSKRWNFIIQWLKEQTKRVASESEAGPQNQKYVLAAGAGMFAHKAATAKFPKPKLRREKRKRA